jgi:hypothetical protein
MRLGLEQETLSNSRSRTRFVIFLTYPSDVPNYHAIPFHQSLKEHTMKVNVGSTDRILRIVVGLALIGLTLAGMIGVWGWIGVVPLLTGVFKFCPAYTLLGMNTCPMEKK